jgi:hypothetical protein
MKEVGIPVLATSNPAELEKMPDVVSRVSEAARCEHIRLIHFEGHTLN